MNSQAKVAASARRSSDHSTSIADHLEEHALEEREAANLRQLARERATTVLLTSDEVLLSTEAQLAEAQKGAAEASEVARASREKADRLAREADNVQRLEPFQDEVEMATEIREYHQNQRCLSYLLSSHLIDTSGDQALAIYEASKASRDEASERAAEAKRVHESNCINLANLERDAMAELLQKQSQDQAGLLAISSCENARALHDRAGEQQTKYIELNGIASDKAAALLLATRYKEKRKRVQPISEGLANLTLLHSCKFRNWAKSSKFPCYSVHAWTDVIEKAEGGKEEWTQFVEFNKSHFSRTVPPSSTKNNNPLLSWAM